MVDILCINPASSENRKAGIYMPHLGIAYLGAFLEKYRYSVKLVDSPIEDMDIKNIIKKYIPSFTFISGTTQKRFDSFKIARIAKEVHPETITVYGGPHATFTAEDTLQHVPWIDIIVRGEGEYTALELVKAEKSYENIPGISYRKNNRIYHNPDRPQVDNLDELPFPAYHLLPMNEYEKKFLMGVYRKIERDILSINMITTRGCPNKCTFCSASAMWKKVKKRSPENVADEIEMLIDNYNINGVNFVDSTLTLDKKHILGICNEIKERSLDISWFCEARVDTVSREILAKMKDAGCKYIQIGVESGSQRILENIKKKITIEQVRKVTQWSNELELPIRAAFMFGLPGETFEDGMATVNLIKELKKKNVDVGINITNIYPGTEIERYARMNGYLPQDFSWSEPYFNEKNKGNVPSLIQPQMGYPELRRLMYELKKDEIFTLKGLSNIMHSIRSVHDLKNYLEYGKEILRGR